ncbi:MAG: 1-deoxy-D-xylulose-5-phosphate reductoisomerase [Acidimicrobiia bacterium]|nr:1-deoxy-D-xylulose-5-phosphate reductoisomerase [Acidimicrobiia bacterium]
MLGSTGSIGTQTLEVAAHLGVPVVALAARRPSDLLLEQSLAHPDANVFVSGGSKSERDDFATRLGRPVSFGPEAVDEAASTPGTTVVNGIVGSVGLGATLSALSAGNRVGLANKESLVAGGSVVKRTLEAGGELIPVDSEHSAIYQCLIGENPESVRRIMLTASGGPFRGRSSEELEDVTPQEALKHPTWDMGSRISIDSATLVNKGLEVIEAHHLFDVDYDRIDVVVHPQSVVHSMVEFVDGSWKGHLGVADMRIPIQYALTAPNRAEGIASPFEFAGRTLEFETPDREVFPALDLAYRAGREGGTSPAVFNAADEVAVEAFLQGRLGFNGIARVVELSLDAVEWREPGDFDAVVEVDREARAVAASMISGAC